MIFRPELIEKIVAGRKTETRRPASDNPRSTWFRERCKLEPGRSYAVQPGRGEASVARIRVTHWLAQESLGHIDLAAAKREGFSSVKAFCNYWEKLYGTFDSEQRVWVVRFELVSA